MVKASATGAIDFANADLQDKYWWRKLRWTVQHLQEEEDYNITEARHRHWITACANSTLTDDSFATAKANAQEYLNKLITIRYPEYAEHLKNQARAQTREGALEAYREKFGYPGDPRYEAMVKRTMDAFKKLHEKYEHYDYSQARNN